jgi:hypothetical protein
MPPIIIRRFAALWALALPLGATACGEKPPERVATVGETLPKLLLPPNPTFVSKSGSADALQITVQTPMAADEVAEYYRKLLKTGGWTLASDAKDRDGATVLLAQHQGPPLWIRIARSSGAAGSQVQLTGAVLSKADSARLVFAKAATARADSVASGKLTNRVRPAPDSAAPPPR